MAIINTVTCLLNQKLPEFQNSTHRLDKTKRLKKTKICIFLDK